WDPQTAAFSNKLVLWNGNHCSTEQLEWPLVCPSFTGEPISELSGKAPYASVPGQKLRVKPPIGIGISTYVAIPATNIALMRAVTPTTNPANGTIVPNKGLTLKSITDGSSRTIIVCETRERSLNSWMDGSVNWVVAANPNNPTGPIIDRKGFLTLPP